MKAARLLQDATELIVAEVPEPELRPGCAIVRIEAVFMSRYMASLVDGSGGLPTPPRPFTPGMDAIGIIESVADDIVHIKPGERVYCDSFYRSHGVGGVDDAIFIGCFPISDKGRTLLARWCDGALAQRMLLPAECAIPLGKVGDLSPPGILCRLGWLGTAYGAFKRAGLRPGNDVAIVGATGLVGVSAILVALAMGAARIFACGRSDHNMDDLAEISLRVSPVQQVLTESSVDVLLSCIEGESSEPIERQMKAIRSGGSIVIVGSTVEPLRLPLGWLLLNDIAVRGSLWFERSATLNLCRMIEAGTLDLSCLESEGYSLDRVNDAIAAARGRRGRKHVAVLCN